MSKEKTTLAKLMSKNVREEYNAVRITYVNVYMYKVYHGLGTVMVRRHIVNCTVNYSNEYAK